MLSLSSPSFPKVISLASPAKSELGSLSFIWTVPIWTEEPILLTIWHWRMIWHTRFGWFSRTHPATQSCRASRSTRHSPSCPLRCPCYTCPPGSGHSWSRRARKCQTASNQTGRRSGRCPARNICPPYAAAPQRPAVSLHSDDHMPGNMKEEMNIRNSD